MNINDAKNDFIRQFLRKLEIKDAVLLRSQWRTSRLVDHILLK